MVLADLGAEVIKIEDADHLDGLRRKTLGPLGPAEHPFSYVLMRGKKSVCLNYKTAQGRRLLLDLAAQCDVVIENSAAGALDRAGIGYVNLRRANAKIIVLSMRGIAGQERYRYIRSGAPGIQAFVGIDSMLGYGDERGLVLGRPMGDVLCGLYGTVGVLAALYRQIRRHEGCHIEVGLNSALLSTFGLAFSRFASNHESQVPPLLEQGCVPYGYFPCKDDDDWIGLAIESAKEWCALCELMEKPEWSARFADRGVRSRSRATLESAVGTWTRMHDAKELEKTLQDAGICATRLMNAESRFKSEHFYRRGLYELIDHPMLGRQPLPTLSWLLRGQGTYGVKPAGPAPPLGANTETVLRDLLGCAPDRIRSLRADGTIR